MTEFKAIKEFLQPSPVLGNWWKVSGAVITVSSHDSTHLDFLLKMQQANANYKVKCQMSDQLKLNLNAPNSS